MKSRRAWSLTLAVAFTLMSMPSTSSARGIGPAANQTGVEERDVEESCMARVLQLLPGRLLSVASTELILKRVPPPIDQLNAAGADADVLSAVLGGRDLATQLVQCLTGQREECQSQHPCNQAGKCVYTTSGAQRGSYQCQCDMGHAGKFCQTALPSCATDPCMNGATCQQRGPSFHCHCPPLHSGRRCEKQWLKERTFSHQSSALFKVIKDVQQLRAEVHSTRHEDITRIDELMAKLQTDVVSRVSASLSNLTSRMDQWESQQREDITRIDELTAKLQTNVVSRVSASLANLTSRMDQWESQQRESTTSVTTSPTTPATTQQTQAPTAPASSCTRGDQSRSGVFIATTSSGRYTAYCDRETDGGGWIVFQRRQDGSVDFYRDWNAYKHGFGSASEEFWLGLETIHQLTSQAGRSYELRIDMVYRSNGQKDYVKYSSFKVDSEDTNYILHVSGFSSSGPSRHDRLSYHDGQAFSTRDRDNDVYSRPCAQVAHGAWWYRACYHSNLNGRYGVSGLATLNFDRGSRRLSFVEMKFRQIS